MLKEHKAAKAIDSMRTNARLSTPNALGAISASFEMKGFFGWTVKRALLFDEGFKVG